jgi:hypothetical protein
MTRSYGSGGTACSPTYQSRNDLTVRERVACITSETKLILANIIQVRYIFTAVTFSEGDGHGFKERISNN